MLLICLRDDIPLSLNEEQCKKMLLHICSKFNCPIEEAYNRFEYFNNIDRHQIHNIFFIDIPYTKVDSFYFFPDALCKTLDDFFPGSESCMCTTSLAYSHGEIINGGPERMYLDAKIKHNPRFNDIIIQLLPFIDEHYNGGNVSDIYWQKNMKITQIFNSKFDKRF